MRHLITVGLIGMSQLATLSLPASAQASRPPAEQFVSAIDDDALLRAFAALSADSMGGRLSGTAGNAMARRFLVQELKRLGVEPLGESHEVSFSARVPARSAGANRPGFIQNRDLITSVENGELITGRNVMGVIRGSVTPDRYIVVSAHFDHVGTQRGVVHPGANDNASGAAALLAVADLLKLAPPKNSVILVWFDAEELGLLGSQAFVRTPPVPLARIVANVNADMLSRSDNGRLFVSGTQFYAAFRPLIDSVASTGFMRVERGHDGTDSREDYYRFSDQWSFHERRIPAVLVTTGNYPDLHRPADTILRANVALYVRAVSAFADLVRRLDDSYDTLFAAKPQ